MGWLFSVSFSLSFYLFKYIWPNIVDYILVSVIVWKTWFETMDVWEFGGDSIQYSIHSPFAITMWTHLSSFFTLQHVTGGLGTGSLWVSQARCGRITIFWEQPACYTVECVVRKCSKSLPLRLCRACWTTFLRSLQWD